MYVPLLTDVLYATPEESQSFSTIVPASELLNNLEYGTLAYCELLTSDRLSEKVAVALLDGIEPLYFKES